MGMAKYVREAFAKSAKERSESYTLRLRKWRKQAVVTRSENPTNPIRAREIGYKAAPGYVIARVRVRRGQHRRRQPDLGRKPGRNRKRVEPGRELKWYAIQRAGRKFANLTPVNAYWVGEDGVYKYFEVILRDDNDSTPKRQPQKWVEKPAAAPKKRTGMTLARPQIQKPAAKTKADKKPAKKAEGDTPGERPAEKKVAVATA